jgi:outer membrane protein OmpA-like peptidoglycan-associated protein
MLALAVVAFGCAGSEEVRVGTSTPETEAVAPEPEPEPEPAPEDPSDVHLEGDHITIDDSIHFATDSAEILDDSSELIDHIATLIQNHDEIATLEIIGHTDAMGGHEHNQELSEARAESVKSALEERGVAIPMTSRGVGETEKVCQEDTDECHARNRRVEFVVTMK